ncbi:MAG: hypothetical protein AAGD07_13190 [Planctomycetota bacterium]
MKSKGVNWAGRGLLGLVGLLMLFAGSGKTFGFAPPDVVESLASSNLGDWQAIIGVGAMTCGALLLFRRTIPIGVLPASSYWGGAILLHMSQQTPFVAPAVLLVLVWLGYGLVKLSPIESMVSAGSTEDVGSDG